MLNQLRDDSAFIRELDFVMEKSGKIIGQNIFLEAVIKSDDGRDIPILTMGPICIAPEFYGKSGFNFAGEYAIPQGYFVDENEAEAFD